MIAARGLAFRLDGAWWAALIAACAALVLSLVKAVAIYEAGALALFAAALLVSRRGFDRKAALLGSRLTWPWIAAVAVVLISALVILRFVFDHAEFGAESWLRFEISAEAPRGLRALFGASLLAGLAATWSLLRPARHEVAVASAADLARAVAIVAAQPVAAANLVRTGDKRLIFSDDGTAFVMFGCQGGSWIALFDPVGPLEAWPELIWRFVETARRAGRRAAFYQAGPEQLGLYADAGLRFYKLGEQARVALCGFELTGGKRASQRNVLSRGEREGLAVEILEPGQAGCVMGRLARISAAWLAARGGGEKSFSLGAFEPGYVDAQRVALLRWHGEIVAFATLMSTAVGQETAIDLMRHVETIPNVAMEFLFLRLCELLKAEGCSWFDLGMAPLSGFSASEAAPLWHRLGRAIYEQGIPSYNFKGLRGFKSKLQPEWRPRLPRGGRRGQPGAGAPGRGATDRPGSEGGKVMRRLAPWLVMAAVLGVGGAAPGGTPGFDPGQIPDPVILLPDGPATGAVLMFSSDAGWSPADGALAARLRSAGAAVVGIDLPAYLAALDAEGTDCVYLVGDFEQLGHQLERATGATTFHAPVIAGTGEGGALALDILTQTPADTLGGAIVADPAAAVPLQTALCTDATRTQGPQGSSYALPAGAPPAALTLVLGADAPPAAAARAGTLAAAGVVFDERTAAGAAAGAYGDALVAAVSAGAGAGDAPAIEELPATPTRGTMAIMISGDGGWRDLDRSVAGVLQARGVPTVGLDALRWFWSPRTPAETAAEIARLIDVYTARWGVGKVLLAGYSFGADVLPETYLALPPEAQARVVQVSLLGPSQQADWQITVSGWLGSASSAARPTGPALARMPAGLVQCIHGQDETDSACPALKGSGAEVIRTEGGHHFDGDYQALAARILDGLGRREVARATIQ